MKKFFLFIIAVFSAQPIFAQNSYELNSGWRCKNIKDVNVGGLELSNPKQLINSWVPATVPGTVLTTLLNNKKVPDPFYGMNNEKISDIYNTGNDYYTYWFVKDFTEIARGDDLVWLKFRGINYKADVFLNGKKLTPTPIEGMFLRSEFNITKILSKNGKNKLAVIVYPPDFPGNPNGGQGGDGTIAKNLTTHYTAGWDWIQPMRDRNTGIWDKVTIEKTKGINLKNPHIVTLVPGKRLPNEKQAPVTLKVSVEAENPTDKTISGVLKYQISGVSVTQTANIPAHSTKEIQFSDLTFSNPKLWWPNGYGAQNLYNLNINFVKGKKILDSEKLKIGIRQIDNIWNEQTKSMGAFVNGQLIFIKGGNWIISDAMLRFTDARYDAEIRYHKDMNLNLIRVWGGALLERPEFYSACDKYGLLVFQDFWFSGDCNGRWADPKKKDDQATRREYPDNHQLVLSAMEDQIKMVRNHASLAFWCGGNEITPPDDILNPLKNDILPRLDGTRILFDFSNSDKMSLGGGDGPYSIQNINSFWATKTFPYNSEVGSVGVGDYVSLQRFIPEQNLIAPQGKQVDSVWEYHTYIGYDNHIDVYGRAKGAKDFAMKAQLVNYNQYRALMEGFSNQMWNWYTGSIIWKTQNPWTALRGQMYDYYLDPNACLYGLRKGAEPFHIMMNPLDSMVTVVNNGFKAEAKLKVEAKVIDMAGKAYSYFQPLNSIEPSSVKPFFSLKDLLKKLDKKEGVFISLRILNTIDAILSDNLYWLPAKDGNYEGLQKIKVANLKAEAHFISKNKVAIKLSNFKSNPVAFFNRVALIDTKTGKRILPCFYDDNYVSVLPGESKAVMAEFTGKPTNIAVEIYGWNVAKQKIAVGK